MKIDLNKELIKEAKKLEDLGFEVPDDLNIKSKKIKNAFGTYTPYTSTVAVDSDFLDFASIKEIRALIAHETCHSISGSYGHDAIWFSAVSKLVENFSNDYDKAEIHLAKPYSKERKSAISSAKHEYHDFFQYKFSKTKYSIVCPNCGVIYGFNRRSKSFIDIKLGLCNCTLCKCDKLDIIQNY